MRKTIAVLGLGLVGQFIASELAKNDDYIIHGYDNNFNYRKSSLYDSPRFLPFDVDLTNSNELDSIINVSDIIVSAVPGFMGGDVLLAAIKAGKPIVDISFSPVDPMAWNKFAKQTGSIAIVDCGVAPGMSNLFAGKAASEMTDPQELTIMVGGLPVKRTWPFDYRLVFSLTDVIEEYTRPCRYIENGHEVIRPALSDAEYVDFPKVGTLEAFNTDGLRTLAKTMAINTMKEKTLRYPGHIEKMRVFREAGFFDDVDIKIGENTMNPRKLTEKLFAKCWNRPAGEEEFTILRVDCKGVNNSVPRRIIYDLYDRTDPQGRTSMARTTGLPAVVMTNIILKYGWTKPGVYPLEILGRDTLISETLIAELRAYGIEINRQDL